jgi:anaerobic magnesium-protoporphyrin IX monomethyl ester cyclase
MASGQPLDIVVLVPFQPYSGHTVEPLYRQTMGSRIYTHLLRGYSEFSHFLGRDLLFRPGNLPGFGPDQQPIEFNAHRSLTAVALATHLERAGLRWKVLDPGQQEIRYWRQQMEALRRNPPRAVGISTTFALGGRWLRALCATVREALPSTKIILGGYYYTSDAADFLSLDADIYCIGAGEQRIETIVAAVRDGHGLEAIPGLYLRRGAGIAHHYTGKAEPLRLDELPSPDWRLAERFEPPRSLAHDFMDVGLESQRGCVFKCEFCTYRTLAIPDFLSVDAAVDRVMSTRIAKRAILRLTDSTATFPRERWAEFMRRLGEKGGSPHPLWVYARASDIDEETAAYMAKAGVREVFIGQESGDQRVLNLMRKGTHVSQVKPALAALEKNGIWSFVSFIHGFPGENVESIQNTRALITSLNEGLPEESPGAAWYNVNPFFTQDFAAVAEKTEAMKNGFRYLNFDRDGETSTQRMAEECLITFMAAARVPNAPVFIHTLTMLDTQSRGAAEPTPALMNYVHRRKFQRWLKSIERGIAIFMARNLEGKPPDLAELKRLREAVLAGYARPASLLQRAFAKTAHRVGPAVVNRLTQEWARESKDGVGAITRLALSGMALYDSGKLGQAVRCLRTGDYREAPAASLSRPGIQSAAEELATDAIAEAKKNGKRVTQLVRDANRNAKPLPVVG